MTSSRRLAGWLAGALLLVAGMMMISAWSYRQIDDDAAARERTNAALRGVSTLLAAVSDAETGQRGYLLTGDEAFLEPYLAARGHIPADLAALSQAGLPGQGHVAVVGPLIDTKLSYFNRNIELRRAGDGPAALANVLGVAGKPLMDTIRAELHALSEEIEAEQAQREADFQASMRDLYSMLVGASLLSLVIGIAFAWLMHREAQRQLQVEVHAVTQRALDTERETNDTLQHLNATLQVSEQRLAVTLNSIGDAVMATDGLGAVTLINPLAERLTGWPREEAFGKPIDEVFEILNEQTRRPATVPVMSTIMHGTTQGLANHTVLVSRNGSECAIADSCAPIRDRDGRVVGAVLVFRDVSVEHEVQRTLRDLQVYTRSLFESNTDALTTTDPTGIITDANKQMTLLTERTRESLIGSRYMSHFTDPERARASIEQVLGGGRVTDFVLTLRARGGRETVVSCNANTFHDGDGKVRGVFAAARDITDRERLDLALQEKAIELQKATAVAERASLLAEKATAVAEKANLAKSEFLSSMSHELRSPLNAILGFAQLMESEEGVSTPDQTERVAHILKAGWHLLALINEILDLAKVESGQVPLSHEPVSLAEVLAECRSMVDHQAQQRSVRLVFPRGGVPLFVRADRIRLKQVIINLLSNAIKYNQDNGAVTVTCTAGLAGRTRMSIADTGAGLSPAQVGQLFQAFNRLGQESGQEEGTGIGLVVSRRLVELMGGEIGVESLVGTGSTFWFELASADAPQIVSEVDDVGPSALPAAPRSARVRSVLYVEDNPANLLLVKQIIARLPGLALLTAVDGLGGVEVARRALPDVILMDVNLPGISGTEAMKILRADPATAHIPVLALSANALPLDVERGLREGFFRYLTKPIKLGEIILALNEALEMARPEP